MRRSQNRPVLRLTLLFFGATKDIPEAAKMVTAGTILHIIEQASQRPNRAVLARMLASRTSWDRSI
jgi:hypothetical protein